MPSKPRSPNETIPRQFRLTAETLDQLDRIAAHYGVTRSDAIRIAARQVADGLPMPPGGREETQEKIPEDRLIL